MQTILGLNDMPNTKTAPPEPELPSWLTFGNILSVITLISLVVSFFVSSARNDAKVENLQKEFAEFKVDSKQTDQKTLEMYQRILEQLAELKGRRDAEDRVKPK